MFFDRFSHPLRRQPQHRQRPGIKQQIEEIIAEDPLEEQKLEETNTTEINEVISEEIINDNTFCFIIIPPVVLIF